MTNRVLQCKSAVNQFHFLDKLDRFSQRQTELVEQSQGRLEFFSDSAVFFSLVFVDLFRDGSQHIPSDVEKARDPESPRQP